MGGDSDIDWIIEHLNKAMTTTLSAGRIASRLIVKPGLTIGVLKLLRDYIRESEDNKRYISYRALIPVDPSDKSKGTALLALCFWPFEKQIGYEVLICLHVRS